MGLPRLDAGGPTFFTLLLYQINEPFLWAGPILSGGLSIAPAERVAFQFAAPVQDDA